MKHLSRLTYLSVLTLCLVFNPSLQGQDANAILEFPETDEGLPGAGPLRRYDWFKNLWLQRRNDWKKSVEKDQGAVVFLGDSITQGWGNTLRGTFGEMKVANRGISGDTTRGMLIRLQDDVLSLNPKGVVLLMGTNDLEEGAEPEVIAGNVKLILTELKAHQPEMPVILSLVFPSSETKKRPADKIQKLNQLCSLAARDFPQAIVVDTWTLFANEQGNAKAEEFPDLLHPNDLGYANWGKALVPLLETVGLLRVAEETFELEPGYRSLFNGTDLSGWGFLPTPDAEAKRRPNPNAPGRPVIKEAMDFSGLKASHDGRYVAKDGRLIVTTPIEGRRIQQLWTTEEFGKDFTLKLEFRATPNADSGVFIRKPQLQCRDFLLAGPYKELKKYKPQDWNELVIVVRGTSAHCTCNGEVLEAEFKVPESGPIGLEGDRGQIEYRRIRIKEEL